MSSVTTKQLVRLVSRAARDPDLRDKFIKSPKSAANALGIKLNESDSTKLKRIAADLKRVSGSCRLAASDANHWAIGVLVNVTHVTENVPPKPWPTKGDAQWQPSILHVTEDSHPRRHKRRK
jgi:hypothetical protein